MLLLVDECVPEPTCQLLRTAKIELLTVGSLGQSGIANGELLNLAKRHGAVLLTVDRGLGNLRTYPLGRHPGVILLRFRRTHETDAVHQNLLLALRTIPAKSLAGSLLIIDAGKYRLRRPLPVSR